MCLRFVFLLVTRVAAWLRLSRREEAWKTAENPDPAPSAHRTAAAAAGPGEAQLGGPGPARSPARCDTEITPAGPAATCRPGLYVPGIPSTALTSGVALPAAWS